MKKLNNQGWGLGVFLAFVVIFIFCIFIASINAYKVGLGKEPPSVQFGDDVNKPSPSPSDNGTSNVSGKEKYKDLIKNVNLAADKYRVDYYSSLLNGDSVFVPIKTLKENNYLQDTKNCSGYVKIINQNGSFQYKTYLKCPDYESDGYISDLDE